MMNLPSNVITRRMTHYNTLCNVNAFEAWIFPSSNLYHLPMVEEDLRPERRRFRSGPSGRRDGEWEASSPLAAADINKLHLLLRSCSPAKRRSPVVMSSSKNLKCVTMQVRTRFELSKDKSPWKSSLRRFTFSNTYRCSNLFPTSLFVSVSVYWNISCKLRNSQNIESHLDWITVLFSSINCLKMLIMHAKSWIRVSAPCNVPLIPYTLKIRLKALFIIADSASN